jgi:hypothetical protein
LGANTVPGVTFNPGSGALALLRDDSTVLTVGDTGPAGYQMIIKANEAETEYILCNPYMAGTDSITTAAIKDNAVTYAKMQDIVTGNRVLGRASAGEIEEVQVATAMVADDAITYAKMQDIVTGNRVLGRASAGEVQEVQVDTAMIADDAVTNDKILDGTIGPEKLVYAEEVLTSGTFSNDATLNIVLSSLDSTQDVYNTYKVYFYDLTPATDNKDLYCRLSTDAGASWLTTAYNYSYIVHDVFNNTVVVAAGGNNVTFGLIAGSPSSAGGGLSAAVGDGGCSCEITIHSMNTGQSLMPNIKNFTTGISADGRLQQAYHAVGRYAGGSGDYDAI